MLNPEHPVIIALAACVLFQVVAWWWQWKLKNADLVDLAWTLGMVVCPLIYLILIPAPFSNVLLVLCVPVLWYLRLLIHLSMRFRSDHEDSRYQHLRAHWSEHTQAKFLAFFLTQAALSVLFSLPALWVLQAPELSWPVFTLAAVFVSLALLGVAISDHQLLVFKRNNPRTAVCDVGFWRYSRHPNYFFEWMHWWVYPLVLWNTPWFLWALVMVGVMLLFLLKLTGIPFAEQQALNNRGEAYQRYQAETSAFILWRKRHVKNSH